MERSDDAPVLCAQCSQPIPEWYLKISAGFGVKTAMSLKEIVDANRERRCVSPLCIS